MKTLNWKPALILCIATCLLSWGQSIPGGGDLFSGDTIRAVSAPVPVPQRERLISATLQDGKVIIEKHITTTKVRSYGLGCSVTLTSNPPQANCYEETTPIKEIYESVNGKIVLTRKIEGKIIPAKYVAERIEWPSNPN